METTDWFETLFIDQIEFGKYGWKRNETVYYEVDEKLF